MRIALCVWAAGLAWVSPAFANSELCQDPAGYCGKMLSAACLQRLGAGQIAASPEETAADEISCADQLVSYGDCVAAAAECTAASETAAKIETCNPEDARALFASVERVNDCLGYAAYLEACPNSHQALLATAAMRRLSCDGGEPSRPDIFATTLGASDAGGQAKETVAIGDPAKPTADAGGMEDAPGSLLDQPLAEGPKSVVGLSLRQLIDGSPDFPPIEGLDTEFWQGKSCNNCHDWSVENLCKQGEFYSGKAPDALDRIKHPFGGPFKRALAHWASVECP